MTQQSHNSRSKKFLKDFGVYAIGNLGSKLITFLMIPLYTYFVERPADYGYFDLCLQVCLLLVPVVTLQLRDGAFRFLLDTDDIAERTRIVSFVYRTIILTTLTTAIAGVCISLVHPVRHLWLTVLLLMVMAFYEILAQVTRGLGNNKAFIAVGLIASFGIGLFSVVLVAWLKMGIVGIFLANILARLLSITLVEMKMRTISRFFSIKADVKIIGRDLIKYSLPLIPVTLCGLVPPFSDRLFIKHFLGLEQAGIYAIAMRTSGIIHSLSIIFYQTWQENAIQQYHSKDRDDFFSKIFNGYVFVLALVFIGYIFVLKMCYSWLIAPNYQSSIIYLYPLGISMALTAISSYFYLPYQCAKDTKRAVPSVVILAVLNVALNMILVRLIGIFGIIATGIISYLVVTIYLRLDTRRYFNLHFYPSTLVPIAVAMLGAIPFYLSHNHLLDAAVILAAIVILTFALPKQLRGDIFLRIKSKITGTRK